MAERLYQEEQEVPHDLGEGVAHDLRMVEAAAVLSVHQAVAEAVHHDLRVEGEEDLRDRRSGAEGEVHPERDRAVVAHCHQVVVELLLHLYMAKKTK